MKHNLPKEVNGLAPGLVTAKQAANYLGVGITKLYQMLNDGTLRKTYIGTAVRISFEDCKKVVREGHKPNPDASKIGDLKQGQAA